MNHYAYKKSIISLIWSLLCFRSDRKRGKVYTKLPYMSACLLFLIQLILSFQTCSNNCDKLNLKNKSYLLWSSKFLSCLSNCDEFNVIWLHQSKANCELYGLLNFCCFVVITCSYSNLFIFRYQSQQDFSWVSANASNRV